MEVVLLWKINTVLHFKAVKISAEKTAVFVYLMHILNPALLLVDCVGHYRNEILVLRFFMYPLLLNWAAETPTRRPLLLKINQLSFITWSFYYCGNAYITVQSLWKKYRITLTTRARSVLLGSAFHGRWAQFDFGGKEDHLGVIKPWHVA